jgi:hypothetical protein
MHDLNLALEAMSTARDHLRLAATELGTVLGGTSA